jgi:hypothetical protein
MIAGHDHGVPRSGGPAGIARRIADARRKLAAAEDEINTDDEALKIIEKRFTRADRRSSDLLDKLLAAQEERDQARQERHRVREHRRRASERAERQRAILDVLESCQEQGEQ